MCLFMAGVISRNQEFFYSRGGGGPVPTAGKQSGQRCCFFLFYSPELILQLTEGVQWFYYRENYAFLRIQRGPEFSRGRGSNFSLC